MSDGFFLFSKEIVDSDSAVKPLIKANLYSWHNKIQIIIYTFVCHSTQMINSRLVLNRVDFNSKGYAVKRLLKITLTFLPLSFFSFSTPSIDSERQTSTQVPEETVAIYMVTGAVMVGVDQIHQAQIVQEKTMKEIENREEQYSISKKDSTGIPYRKLVNSRNNGFVSKKATKKPNVLFFKAISTQSIFSEESFADATAVLAHSITFQNFSLGFTDGYQDCSYCNTQRNKKFHISFSNVQHLKYCSSSLRDPPSYF